MHRISEWRSVLAPEAAIAVRCPSGLHRATFKRLVREYGRLLGQLDALPERRLPPYMRRAYAHQFLNRILRIRRVLRLATPAPPARRWYRTGEAAFYLGISTKTLVRWTARGVVRCSRAGYRAHRYYPAAELVRVRRELKA